MSEIDKFLGTWKFHSQSDTIEETLKAQGMNSLSIFNCFKAALRNELGHSENRPATHSNHNLLS